MEKYHPVTKARRESVIRQQLRSRVNAFVSLLQSGRLDKFSLDSENSDHILQLMDAGKNASFNICFSDHLILVLISCTSKVLKLLPSNRASIQCSVFALKS